MQKTPDDFNIYYIPEDITIDNIWEFGYTDVIKGYGFTNQVEYELIIKTIFVDKDGKLRCIEDSHTNFVFTQKEVDKDDKE